MNLVRKSIIIRGAVQGVGFRPFVYRTASRYPLSGTVANTSAGVRIEAQSTSDILDRFITDLHSPPPAAVIDEFRIQDLTPISDEESFSIVHSEDAGEKSVTVLPDLVTCPDCRKEIADPQDRRFGYPFTNCTNCGPRFSIINAIPYDRPNTEMHRFTMCPECQAEYDNPLDRRFHAQPNACPQCGPTVSLIHENRDIAGSDVFHEARQLLRAGGILALKGIGGYQLLCDATNQETVIELRNRKHREMKPFALMVQDIETASKLCHVSLEDEELLTSLAAPIVLLEKRKDSHREIVDEVAPENPQLGVMLPYSPIHQLLFKSADSDEKFVLVCTSGNIHDEPLAISNQEAMERLSRIADAYLTHNRPIARQVDDSVVRHTAHGTQYLRRARGYAPFPVVHHRDTPTILSVGAHLKNTIGLTANGRTVVSQHIGDLSNAEAYQAFCRICDDLPRLYGIQPELAACDLHPDYLSTTYANTLGIPVVPVQHHHAHIAAVLAEHSWDAGPVFGISWDGTGLGTDQTVWGGEFLICERGEMIRWGHLRRFPLPGGDKAAQEPRRSAAGILHAINSGFALQHGWSSPESQTIQQMLAASLNSPLTSSMGRLFDAVASLLGFRQITHFEGQTAMQLEYIAEPTEESYRIDWQDTILDWQPMIQQILADIQTEVHPSLISGKFHQTLIQIMVDATRQSGIQTVAIGGGVFQNRILFQQGVSALRAAGFKVLLPKQMPSNDGSISLGQAWVAATK